MLAEKRSDEGLSDEGLEKQYAQDLTAWAERISALEANLRAWQRPLFWHTVEEQTVVTPRTRAFIDDWFSFVFDGQTIRQNASRLYGQAPVRRLIETRESALKGPRARLRNPRALELWTGAAGTQQLAYRWPQAQRIVLDILDGLQGEDDDHA